MSQHVMATIIKLMLMDMYYDVRLIWPYIAPRWLSAMAKIHVSVIGRISDGDV